MTRSQQPEIPLAVRVTLVVLVIAGFAGALFTTWRSATALDEHGLTTTAQVQSLNRSKHNARTATVRFTTADGRTITTETRPDELLDDPLPAVGSTIPIVYDPADPTAPVRDPRADRDTPLSPIVIAGAGAVFLGVVVVRMARRRTRPDRSPGAR